MTDPAAALSGLFAELKKLEHNGDFEKALKTANKSTSALVCFDDFQTYNFFPPPFSPQFST